MEQPVLNEPQRRHYAVLLAMLEETLREIEHLASGAPLGGRLTPVHSDLPPETMRLLVGECAQIRQRVYALAERLGVPSRPASATSRVHAALIASVVHLEDSTADKLAGYGAVDASVERLIDPTIVELRKRLGALAARVHPAES
ncbi:MAG: hypothetical protein ACHQX4_05390 [Gemmatimonadales bacterium]